MIKVSEVQTNIEFGTGDVCITSGSFLDDKKFKAGIITFSNQTPREIGIGNGDVKAGQDCKVEDFPVILTFYKKESIDVLIKSLQETKELMK